MSKKTTMLSEDRSPLSAEAFVEIPPLTSMQVFGSEISNFGSGKVRVEPWKNGVSVSIHGADDKPVPPPLTEQLLEHLTLKLYVQSRRRGEQHDKPSCNACSELLFSQISDFERQYWRDLAQTSFDVLNPRS